MELTEQLTPKSDPVSHKMNLSEFAGGTTLHGFKHIAGDESSHTKTKRVTWAVLFLGFMVACGVFLVIAISQYFHYESVTSLTHEVSKTLDFPAVTICNMQLKGSSSVTILDNYVYQVGITASQLNTNATYRAWYEEQLKKISYKAYGETVKYSLEDTFVTCTFQNEAIPCASYFELLYTDLAVCFTFHSENFIQANGTLTSSSPGPEYGLELVLDAKTYDIRNYNLEFGLGFLVLVHDPWVSPLIKERGFLVTPGVQTYVALQKSINRKLSVPYSSVECVEAGNMLLQGTANYSQELCQLLCLESKVYNGSCSVRAVDPDNLCNLYHIAKYGLASGNLENYYELLKECECRPTCDRTLYSHSITFSYLSETILLYNAAAESWPSQDAVYLTDNYVHVKIFFDSLDYSLTVQKATLSFQSVVSDLGGILGIFLGASFLTIIEIIEYVVVAVYVCCVKFKKRNIKEPLKVTPIDKQYA